MDANFNKIEIDFTHFATKKGWFNFTNIPLERHLVTQLSRSDHGWKAEGLGHQPI